MNLLGFVIILLISLIPLFLIDKIWDKMVDGMNISFENQDKIQFFVPVFFVFILVWYNDIELFPFRYCEDEGEVFSTSFIVFFFSLLIFGTLFQYKIKGEWWYGLIVLLVSILFSLFVYYGYGIKLCMF
tara:strand:+ start:152 stop:538 length:387 start_codon:yes stop_codon:yes gene_type:complete